MSKNIPRSEDEFLKIIDAHFSKEHPHMPVGRGDDCAQVSFPERAVVTTDLFLEGVHFRRSYFEAGDVGHKALAVNVSDIAGMGCKPLGFSLGLMVPDSDEPDADYWHELFAGMSELAKKHDIPLTGGDLSKSPMLGLCVTIWGAPGEGGRVLKRETGNPGDVILCVGDFGLVRAGLYALEHRGSEAEKIYPDAVSAHRRPIPRVGEGLVLADIEGVTSCMDMSDGLARDLPRLLGECRGAELQISEDDLHPEVQAYCVGEECDPVQFAFLGGEDYALLATATLEGAKQVLEVLPHAQIIGAVTDDSKILLNGKTPEAPGFDHFCKES